MATATIQLDLTNPIDVVRALVGDFDTSCPIMSNNMYQQLLDRYTDLEESTGEWFAAIDACDIIARHYAQSGLRSRERVNAVEVEEYGNERYKAYKDTCEWLRSHPPFGSDAQGAPLFFLAGGCNNGLLLSGIGIGWLNAAILACHALTWENGYYRLGPDLRLGFIGTIEVNLCNLCGGGFPACGCGSTC